MKQWYTLENSGVSESEWERNLICITFLIIFFGVDTSQYDFLKEQLEEIITNESAWKDIESHVLKPIAKTHKKTKEDNKNKSKGSKCYLKYDGYQNILGHYFRHLFQTVKFINKQNELSYFDKYNYIKILRAQLSTFEQVLFFYNSLSTFGLPWEKSNKILKDDDRLISKYNLVKNITFKLNNFIYVRTFYPLVTFEGEEKTEERIEMENRYS
ncbi:MAG: putative phage abortive infection protein [Candidatus Heimdallarchaeota archaeon]